MNFLKKSIGFLAMASLLIATDAAQGDSLQMINPPIAIRKTKITEIHGHKLSDPYHWLRGKDKPEVQKYLKAENAYTEDIMKDTEKLQVKLFKEMKARIKETDLSVPQKIDGFYYYSKTEEGKQYSIHCRKSVAEGAKEEVIFDENEYATGKQYFSLGTLKISPNHEILAFSIDNSGAEKFTLQFKNLKTKEIYSDKIASTTYGVQWANDNKTIFYSLMDGTGRSNRVVKHILGTDSKNDQLIYEEKDGQFWTGIGKTKSRKYLVISSSSSTTSECRILEADNPNGKFRIFEPRRKGIEYGIVHQGEHFYVLTNHQAINFKIMKTHESKTHRKNWRAFIPHRKTILIDDLEAFKDFLVVYERKNGLQTIRYQTTKDKKFHSIKFPEPVYSYSQGSNPEYDTKLLRYTYTSLTTPSSVFDFDMTTQKTELKKQYEVLGDFDSKNYKAERFFARAKDGIKVPVSLVYKKGALRMSGNPLYLTSYGSYGSSYDPYFSSVRLSLLDRGFIYAIAHIRGGQEMGRPWYDNGKMLKKKNTFTDFIACAESLIKRGYTTKEKLVINGGSAGGLLMGAVTNMRPDLFKAVVADVPFVDVINTMLDPSLPLVKEEYEEWGNPNKVKYFNYMYSYSPYDNIKAQKYPHLLVTAGLNDPRVSYWEPAKFVAKLRTYNTSENMLLLKTNMDAGHAGASGRYDYLKEIAFEYAFLIKALKM